MPAKDTREWHAVATHVKLDPATYISCVPAVPSTAIKQEAHHENEDSND
jgi:hypothetical protein